MELEQRLTLVRDLVQELEQAMQPQLRLKVPFLKRWALVRDPIDTAYWQRRFKRVLLLLELDLPVVTRELEQPRSLQGAEDAADLMQTMKLNLQELKAKQQPLVPQNAEEDLMQTMKLNLQELKAQAVGKELDGRGERSQQRSWMPQEDLLQTMKLNLQELEKQATQQSPLRQPSELNEDLLQTMKLNLQELKRQAERQDWLPKEDLVQTMKPDLSELKRQSKQEDNLEPMPLEEDLLQRIELDLQELQRQSEQQP